MKIALVHDFLNEFGGAERVLRVLSDMYPKAPIYTALVKDGSESAKRFSDRKIHESFLAPILKIWKLYSPLRFLIPWVWGSMDLSEYDLVITSASSYIARGFKVGKNTTVICYCHTPPRYLYGYETSIELQKYWPVKIYASIVNHFLRMYDFATAQKVDFWIANSKNVQSRIAKFYRRNAVVIYPPVEVEEIINATKGIKKQNFLLIVSRLVGAKGLEEAAVAANQLGFSLKIIGTRFGFSSIEDKLRTLAGEHVELIGHVADRQLYKLYAQAKGFIALAKQEDFGMTVVEAQAAGTPVIAFNGGGFRETVVDGKTGVLINSTSAGEIKKAIRKLDAAKWNREMIQNNARKFSKERFKDEFKKFVNNRVEVKENG